MIFNIYVPDLVWSSACTPLQTPVASISWPFHSLRRCCHRASSGWECTSEFNIWQSHKNNFMFSFTVLQSFTDVISSYEVKIELFLLYTTENIYKGLPNLSPVHYCGRNNRLMQCLLCLGWAQPVENTLLLIYKAQGIYTLCQRFIQREAKQNILNETFDPINTFNPEPDSVQMIEIFSISADTDICRFKTAKSWGLASRRVRTTQSQLNLLYRPHLLAPNSEAESRHSDTSMSCCLKHCTEKTDDLRQREHIAHPSGLPAPIPTC